MKPQVIHILAGLIAAGVLGLMFSNTRMVGVACTALLCYLFPIVALILALLGLLVLFFLHRRKNERISHDLHRQPLPGHPTRPGLG